LLALIVVIVVGIYALLHSSRFHNYVLETAQNKAIAALGTNVHIQNFALNFSGASPTLDVYGIVVDGVAPYARPPLLQVQHARVGLQIVSLLRRNWYLKEVVLDHPVIHASVDKHGNSNIPVFKSSGQKSNKSVFDLGVRHAVLDRGEIYYNNRKSAMDADLHELQLQSRYDTGNRTYSGTLGYSNGHLHMADYNTISHDFHAQFTASPDELRLQNAILRSGYSQFVLNATLTDYAEPKVTADYRAVLDAGEFRQILRNPTIPTGTIDLGGNLQYASRPDTPFLNGVVLRGNLASKQLQVRTPQFSGTIRNVGANYTIANGNLDVQNLGADLLGGSLRGTLAVRDIVGAQQSQLNASLQSVSAGALKSMVKAPALQNIGVAGRANANLKATWQKAFTNLQADVDASVNSTVTPRGTASSPIALSQQPNQVAVNQSNQSIPVTGQIRAHYSGKNQQLSLSNSYIRTPQTTLTFNGALNSRAGLAVNLNHVNLHQLASLADIFGTSGKPVVPPGISGIADFNGVVRGTPSAPRLTGLLTVNDLVVNGTMWQRLRTNVDVSPSRALLNNGSLTSQVNGHATFSLRVGLHHWSFTKTSPFTVAVNASQLNVGNLAHAVGVQTQMDGILSAKVNARGTESTPVGTAQIALAEANVAGQPVQSFQVSANSNGNVVDARLELRTPAGAATGTGRYDFHQQNYEGSLRAAGIQLAQLAAVKKKNLGLSGAVNLEARGQGNIHNPQLIATLQIPRLRIQNQAANNVNLQADVGNHVAKVNLNSQLLNTSLRGQATVNLTGDYQTTAVLDTQTIPLAPLVAVYAPTQAGNITGQTEIHGTLRGPLKKRQLLEGHLTIPALNVQYKSTVQIGAPQPIHLDYVNGVLDLQRSLLKGTGTDLQFQGRVPVVNKSAPISLLLLGTVDLHVAQLFNPDLTTSGQLQFNINSFGQRTDPNMEGEVRVVDAAFASGDMPVGLSKGNGVLTLTRDRLNITEFTGVVGGGQVTASGGVVYRPGLQFDMALHGRGIRLLYPDGVRSGLGLNLTLTGTTEAANLRGQVNLVQLSFTPDFDLTQVMGQFGGTTTPPPAQGFSNNLQLDLNVRSTQGINLVNRQLSVQGSMNLNVRGSAAQPVVLGRVNLTGGDVLFNNERFVLQGGTIDFANPSYTQPVLNVSVNTTVQQYRVAMRFEGPVDQMRTSYTSDPALPPADIIHLIAFGSTTEAAAANPSPPGNLAAEQKIASAVSGQVTSRVAKIAGLSQLSIDPTLGGPGGQSNPGANITVQQRVTSKIFVTFSTDVTSTQNQVIQLEYKHSPRLSFSGTRDQNGGVAFDARIHKAW
jgi:translocation and assembly module TamB